MCPAGLPGTVDDGWAVPTARLKYRIQRSCRICMSAWLPDALEQRRGSLARLEREDRFRVWPARLARRGRLAA